MKSIVFSYSDLAGGAAIAAYRTHQALLHVGVNSSMWVNKKNSDDWTVKADTSVVHRLKSTLRATVGRALPEMLFRDNSKNYRSYNWIPSGRASRLNTSDADIVHLHWVNSEVLSVKDIAAIVKPKIMTLHDMWAFCGAEHYTQDDRWRLGYTQQTRPANIKGLDLDRWVWRRKQKHWQQPFQLVAIS